MARRRPDPRVTRSATPPLARVRGKNAQRELVIHVATHKCDKCERTPMVTQTIEGRIHRRCSRHYVTQLAPIERTLSDSGYWATR